jgi:glycosyltransferase involved in cell wall biosynthesis
VTTTSVELTVITVTYRDPAGLRATLASLGPLARSPIAWEHIVVDSSPEETKPALAVLAEQGWPLRHIETPPQGVYAAMNAGILNARGACVWFLNGGDLLKDVAVLQLALDLLRADPEAAMALASAEIMRDGAFQYVHRHSRNEALNLVGMNRVCHQAVVYRREELERFGPYSTDLKIAADYELHLKAYLAGARALFVDGNLASYDRGGRSDDYRAAFAEFERVQERLASSTPLWLRAANGVFRPLERSRVAAMKLLVKSPLGSALRKAWAWSRRRMHAL